MLPGNRSPLPTAGLIAVASALPRGAVLVWQSAYCFRSIVGSPVRIYTYVIISIRGVAMELSIEDAGRPCPKCALPLKYFTLTRTPEYLPPITIVGCPTCGVPNWHVETEAEQPTKSLAI